MTAPLLQDLMARENLPSISALARRTGLTVSTMWRVVNGRTIATDRVVAAVLTAFPAYDAAELFPLAGRMGKNGDPALRFWPKVDKDGPVPAHRPDLGPCWLWRAQIGALGYGLFWPGPGATHAAPAHCWAYEHLIGPIPDGLEMDHLCRVRHCVNPQHVEPVTHQINCQRAKQLLTHCRQGHTLDPTAPTRRCPTCHAARVQRGRARAAERRANPPPSTPIPLETLWFTSVFKHAQDRDWTDARLAQEMGVSAAMICRVRSGERWPTIRFLQGAMRAFPALKPDDLLWSSSSLIDPTFPERKRGRQSRRTEPYTPFSVELPVRQVEQVRLMARAQGLSINRVIQDAIGQMLDSAVLSSEKAS